MLMSTLNISYYEFTVEPLQNEDAERVQVLKYNSFLNFSKLFNTFPDCEIISKDQLLFSFNPPIEAEEQYVGGSEEKVVEIENKFTMRQEGNEYYASGDGILVYFEDKIEFILLSYDASCEINISADKTSAYASFYPLFNVGKNLNEAMVLNEIKQKGIVVRPILTNIQEALEKFLASPQIMENILVAEGTKPGESKEGYVEYLFNIDKEAGPAINEDGHIDFYNLNLLESVEANQVVAKYFPTIEGAPGADVFGQEIPPPKLKDCKPPKGKSLYTTEAEPNIYLSKIDGFITLKNGEVIITNEYNIRGDVDFHTGNVICKGKLNVVGNVKSGFRIEMSQDIKIGGYVKDAIIKTGGNVNIVGGFSGKGEGLIDAGKNVFLRYIRSQTVYAGGDISVEKEVVDSKLYAEGNIISQSNRMMLIGGYALAGKNISVKNIGHEYGIPTKVEAGHDYKIHHEIRKITSEIAAVKEELFRLKEEIEKITANNKPISGMEQKFKELIVEFHNKKKDFDSLKESRKELKDNILKFSGSSISATGTIYPGVTIVIDGHKFKVNEEMHNKKFFVAEKDEGISVTDA